MDRRQFMIGSASMAALLATAATPRGYQLKDAAELSLSVKTIANNVSNIFSKLEVADRAEAIIRARDAGLSGEAAKLDHPR